MHLTGRPRGGNILSTQSAPPKKSPEGGEPHPMKGSAAKNAVHCIGHRRALHRHMKCTAMANAVHCVFRRDLPRQDLLSTDWHRLAQINPSERRSPSSMYHPRNQRERPSNSPQTGIQAKRYSTPHATTHKQRAEATRPHDGQQPPLTYRESCVCHGPGAPSTGRPSLLIASQTTL